MLNTSDKTIIFEFVRAYRKMAFGAAYRAAESADECDDDLFLDNPHENGLLTAEAFEYADQLYKQYEANEYIINGGLDESTRMLFVYLYNAARLSILGVEKLPNIKQIIRIAANEITKLEHQYKDAGD